MAKISEQFKKLVSRILDERGLSLRAAMYKTGISHSVIGDMKNGVVPSKDIVTRFADGLNVDAHPLLIAAGYEEPDLDTQLKDVLKRVQCSGDKNNPLAQADIMRIVKEKLTEIKEQEESSK